MKRPKYPQDYKKLTAIKSILKYKSDLEEYVDGLEQENKELRDALNHIRAAYALDDEDDRMVENLL